MSVLTALRADSVLRRSVFRSASKMRSWGSVISLIGISFWIDMGLEGGGDQGEEGGDGEEEDEAVF